MKIFLIQTVGGEVVHDFAFGLIEAVKYYGWYYKKDNPYKYILSETTDLPRMNNIQYYPWNELIPVGSVEFVLEFLARWYGITDVPPVNIPEELRRPEYLKRNFEHIVLEHPTLNEADYPVFVKGTTHIKGYAKFIDSFRDIPAGDYLLSEFVTIDSEWRAFVFNGELVGLYNYAGDFTVFPDVALIKSMMKDYISAPPAYTLDVGINDRGTFIIECHDFFSCGLYGFSDCKLLPRMFVTGWNHVIKKYGGELFSLLPK